MNKQKTAPKKEGIKYTLETFITTFLTSYFITSIYNLLSHIDDEVYYTSLDFLQSEEYSGAFVGQIVAIALLMLALTALEFTFPKFNITPNLLVSSAAVLAILLMYKSDTSQYYMYFAVMLVMAIVMVYATEKKCFSFIKTDFH